MSEPDFYVEDETLAAVERAIAEGTPAVTEAPRCGVMIISSGETCGAAAPTHAATFTGADVVTRRVPLCDRHHALLAADQAAGDAPPPAP